MTVQLCNQPHVAAGRKQSALRSANLDGVILVMGRRRRAGQVVDLIDLNKEGVNDVVLEEREVRVTCNT